VRVEELTVKRLGDFMARNSMGYSVVQLVYLIRLFLLLLLFPVKHSRHHYDGNYETHTQIGYALLNEQFNDYSLITVIPSIPMVIPNGISLPLKYQ
jgi:hypothetical protein